MPVPLESLGYLLDIPSVHARGVEGRNRFEVGDLTALGRSILAAFRPDDASST
jgi:hypothetical protein